MKGAIIMDYSVAPTIGGSFSYLLGAGSYGNYPEIQAVWDQYRQAVPSQTRKEFIGRVQTMIHEKKMFIPITGSGSPSALHPKIKGNPYKIHPLIFYTTPFEDIELEK